MPLTSALTHPGTPGTPLLPALLNLAPGLWPRPISAGSLQLADLRNVLALCSLELRGPGRGAQGLPSQAYHFPPALAQYSYREAGVAFHDRSPNTEGLLATPGQRLVQGRHVK